MYYRLVLDSCVYCKDATCYKVIRVNRLREIIANKALLSSGLKKLKCVVSRKDIPLDFG